MIVSDAIRSLAGAPTLIALRPGGPMVMLTNRQRMNDVRSGVAHRWTPAFSDIVAIDWVVVTLDQLRKSAAAAPGQGSSPRARGGEPG